MRDRERQPLWLIHPGIQWAGQSGPHHLARRKRMTEHACACSLVRRSAPPRTLRKKIMTEKNISLLFHFAQPKRNERNIFLWNISVCQWLQSMNGWVFLTIYFIVVRVLEFLSLRNFLKQISCSILLPAILPYPSLHTQPIYHKHFQSRIRQVRGIPAARRTKHSLVSVPASVSCLGQASSGTWCPAHNNSDRREHPDH